MLKSQGLRSVLAMSVGTVGATVVSALAMIIFSRALGPSQFGVFSVLFSLLLILSRIGDLGINVAVQRFIAQNRSNPKLISQYARAGTALKLIIILVISLVGLFFGRYIAQYWLNLPSSAVLPVQLVFLFSVGVVFYEYATSILQGLQQFNLSIISNWIQSLTKFMTAILTLLFSSLSLVSLTVLYLLAPLLGGMASLIHLPATYFSPSLDKTVLHKIVAVSKWTGMAILAATIADNFDVLIVQNLLTSYDTGLYSAAVRIASIASLVAWSLGTVLNVRVATYHDKENLHAYLKKAALLAVVTFIGICALILFSSPAIQYTVGAEFLPAVASLNYLFLATAILTATAPFVALFYLFDRPQYFAYSGILGTAILLGLDLLLIPTYGLLGATYARIASRFAVLIFTLLYARTAYQEKYVQK